ncbi:hypothetical protein HYU14_03660 [Candidatus Woesearchaeota archaeon]|nr:hypothetical protein [Candidatus Woesearchaeota archaeon]
MKRGRPHKSQIRQNMVELLYFLKEGYGYELFKHYRNLFAPVTMRVVYYHLKKGTQLGEFQLSKVIKEEGDFSWGNQSEKNYYSLGPNAKPLSDLRVKSYFSKIAENRLDWEDSSGREGNSGREDRSGREDSSGGQDKDISEAVPHGGGMQ